MTRTADQVHAVRAELEALCSERVLLIDGAMGTMVQNHRLGEAQYRGRAFEKHGHELRGCHDILCLTQPGIIAGIHCEYLEAGADVIETNTFSANAISLADYGLSEQAYAINLAAAQIARAEADRITRAVPEKPRFVAGSMGPTNRSASMSPSVDKPGFRAVNFDELREAYFQQALGLIDGGVDLLACETVFDTLNGKAALVAIEDAFAQRQLRLPVMVFVTITAGSGRTLTGQTVEAFWVSIAHARPFAIGINCSTGAEAMRPYLEELSALAGTRVVCMPNAGLPNALGTYDEPAEHFAAVLGEFGREGWLNLAGGCCGTTPAHIRALSQTLKGVRPRAIPTPERHTRLAGLETLTIRPDSNFIVIGERTNATGSRKFAELVRAGDFEAALSVARQQVDGGANILDVCLDEALIDAPRAMTTFLHLIASEPAVARLPIMIDSSRFEVIEAGLKCLQGKGIVNSLSLKEGEEPLREQARCAHRYGAAVMLMAFDEQGQAVTAERKVAVLSRAYQILTDEVGFAPEEIIFDPAVLTLATGMEEHNGYGVAFLDAVRALKAKFPQALVSAGVSNVSFALRGNDLVRRAMNAAFLYHAIRAGLDMGIVNAGGLMVYDDVPPELRELVEDVILNRRPDATERLITYARARKADGSQVLVSEAAWRTLPLDERIKHAFVHGIDEFIATDVDEARRAYGTALSVIEGPLMAAMNAVGELFGAGKMFLPQVVRSARVMKRAVAALQPFLDAQNEQRPGANGRGRVLLATVKGDVHDIGKNIVATVLGCNGYEVIDLGVMVPGERIVAVAMESKADMVALSGLITPSLDEMAHVARELERVGLRMPLLIGGAATNTLHTAIKIAPAYQGPVVHVRDASQAVRVAGELRGESTRERFVARIRSEQARLQEPGGARPDDLLTYDEARARRLRLVWKAEDLARPAFVGRRTLGRLPLSQLVRYVDWTPFFHAWELKGTYPSILERAETGPAARELFANAERLLESLVQTGPIEARAAYGFFPAAAEGDDIVLFADETRTKERARLHTLRQQRPLGPDATCLALADFVAPLESGLVDYVGAFVVSAGFGVEELAAQFRGEGDEYRAILVKALADRLAEAAAEMLHERARRDCGFGAEEHLAPEDLVKERYRGIRPAPGYPACPEHSEKTTLFSLLDATGEIGVRLTASGAMLPAASVAGWYFNHPKARYFGVGRIGADQAAAYAARKGVSVAQAKQWLALNLGYRSAGQ